MSCTKKYRKSLITLISIMVALLLIAAACFVLGAPNAADAAARQSDPTKTLKLVHAVFRHGPRTPADTYPTDPHINETFHPFGWGQLTNKGKAAMYETGQWLNRRYGGFLSKYYIPDEIWAQSTGVGRAQMSMAMVMAGLFPPKNTDMQWSPSLNWQPVPIFSEPLDEDKLLLVRTPCPRYHEAVEEVFQTPEVKKVLADNDAMFKELTKLTGMPIKTPDDVQSLYGTLRAETEHGLRLPDWTDKYFPKQLQPLTEASFIYNIYTDELKRLKAGPFLHKLIKEYSHKRNGTFVPSGRKMFAYAGHDSTIVNILSAIGVWEQQLPLYGMMGIFELLEDNNTKEWGVRVYLRRLGEREATPLTIPGCEQFCPLDKFIEMTKHLDVSEKNRECTPKNKNFVTPPPSGP